MEEERGPLGPQEAEGDAERLSAAEARVAELEAARAAWLAERRELRARQAVDRQARRLGVVDEDAAWRLLAPDALAYDAAGAPTNVEEALRALVAERPWLVRGGAPGPEGTAGPETGGAWSGVPGTGRGAQLLLEALRRMSPDEINANWPSVQSALRRGR